MADLIFLNGFSLLAANYGASTEYADTITTGGNTYRPLGVFLLPT